MNALTQEFTTAIEAQFSKLNADVKSALEKAGIAEGLAATLEQKMARTGPSGDYEPVTAGRMVADSEQVKALVDLAGSQPGRVKIEVKSVTSASDSGGALAVPMRDNNVNALPGRAVRVRDLLTVLNTTSGSVEYAEQTERDNNAAPQVEAALKTESNYAWELKNLPIRTIAHFTRASVQILSDSPQLISLIDNELRYGLAIAEENQLLNGNGTGANLTGLIPAATAYADPLSLVAPTMIDTIGAGMLQVTLADFMPNGVLLHPSDWMRIRLLKNADGEYLLGDPQSNPNPLLFGLAVVPSTAMQVDKFLIGDFGRGATLYDRQAPTVALSTEDGDNFVRNLVSIRMENRLGLAIKNPTAMAYGDFGNV